VGGLSDADLGHRRDVYELIAIARTLVAELRRTRDGARDAAWQFNEAVSLLREARGYVREGTSTALDIDEGLPAIQAALEALADSIREPP